tara:strand:+ start:5914 stop:6150 length:237 start_codon:yes stop_codon:yes gene_type:complete
MSVEIDNLEDGALILDGLDDAIVGSSDCGLLVYDYKKMVSVFMSQGMGHEEAVEWIDYNVLGVKCNGKGFIMMHPKEV